MDDNKFKDAVEIIEEPMTQEQVISLMDESLDRNFADDVPLFKMRIIKSADHDGIYIQYKTFHSILDGTSMIKVISRMQDGGVEADKLSGNKAIHRPDLSLAQILKITP